MNMVYRLSAFAALCISVSFGLAWLASVEQSALSAWYGVMSLAPGAGGVLLTCLAFCSYMDEKEAEDNESK